MLEFLTRFITHSVFVVLVTLSCLLWGKTDAAELSTTSLNGSIRVTSWKALRDFRVVKQALDYSCGAASVAKILNEFYGFSLTEKDTLDAMEQDGVALPTFDSQITNFQIKEQRLFCRQRPEQ